MYIGMCIDIIENIYMANHGKHSKQFLCSRELFPPLVA